MTNRMSMMKLTTNRLSTKLTANWLSMVKLTTNRMSMKLVANWLIKNCAGNTGKKKENFNSCYNASWYKNDDASSEESSTSSKRPKCQPSKSKNQKNNDASDDSNDDGFVLSDGLEFPCFAKKRGTLVRNGVRKAVTLVGWDNLIIDSCDVDLKGKLN